MGTPTMGYEDRLHAAFEREELRGLRLGAQVRLVSMGVIAAWLTFQIPAEEIAYYWVLLTGFVLAGWLPYEHRRRGRRWRWPRYVYPFVDAALLTFCLLAPNPLDEETYPPQLFLRFGNEIYFFLLIASTVFHYTPRVVLWSGLSAVLTWGAGTLWIASLPGSVLFSHGRLHALPTTGEEVAYILTPRLVDLNVLAEQAIVFLLVAGTLALAVSRFRALLMSHAEAERQRANLARHFSPNMVEELSRMDEPLRAARSQSAAILFADVVGFTRLAETRAPEDVLALLREVLGLMARRVFRHGGTLDKYLGDGIMATFGTPRASGREAEDALACARGILADVAAMNAQRSSSAAPPVEVGIGLHFGPVVVGDVGDESRLELTVVGDTVNTASRLERLTRDLGVHLVVSGAVISALGARAQDLAADLVPRTPQQLRGRQAPAAVWTL
jgi:adenylate cyclase